MRRKFEKQLDAHIKRVEEYSDNLPMVYAIIWGQCTTSLRHRLMQYDDFHDFDTEKDPLPLWKRVSQTCIEGSSKTENIVKKRVEARERFFRVRQGPQEPLGEFYERFKSEVDCMEQSEAWMVPPGTPPEEAEARARYLQKLEQDNDKELAMAFLLKLDKKRFKGLLDELENSLSAGKNEYPITLVGSYTLAMHRKEGGITVGAVTNISQRPTPSTTDAAFAAQGGDKTPKAKKQGNDRTRPRRQPPVEMESPRNPELHAISAKRGDTSEMSAPC
jgi:hypothetical protein